MKKYFKLLLPQAALNTARNLRNQLQLRGLGQLDFATDNLRSAVLVELEKIWSDSTVAVEWEKDHKAIATLFGDDDKMEGVNPGDRRALYYLIKSLEPQSVLEVGTHIGASTLYIARALKRLGGDRFVVSVDIYNVNDRENGPWKRIGLHQPPVDFARDLDCNDLIKFVASPCLDYMSKQIDQKFDFIFLDGDHSAGAVYREVSAALPLLNEGGTILLHDYYPEKKPLFPDRNVISGPFMALDRVRRENPEIDVIPLGKLPWETKQDSNITSLALIVKSS